MTHAGYEMWMGPTPFGFGAHLLPVDVAGIDATDGLTSCRTQNGAPFASGDGDRSSNDAAAAAAAAINKWLRVAGGTSTAEPTPPPQRPSCSHADANREWPAVAAPPSRTTKQEQVACGVILTRSKEGETRSTSSSFDPLIVIGWPVIYAQAKKRLITRISKRRTPEFILPFLGRLQG